MLHPMLDWNDAIVCLLPFILTDTGCPHSRLMCSATSSSEPSHHVAELL